MPPIIVRKSYQLSRVMGDFQMETVPTLTAITAFASFAFIGAIILGLI